MPAEELPPVLIVPSSALGSAVVAHNGLSRWRIKTSTSVPEPRAFRGSPAPLQEDRWVPIVETVLPKEDRERKDPTEARVVPSEWSRGTGVLSPVPLGVRVSGELGKKDPGTGTKLPWYGLAPTLRLPCR